MKHNLTYTPEYIAWKSIKTRCLNSKSTDYKYYGGRGISIFPGWIDNPVAFVDHIGLKPAGDYTVDRIDPNKDYEPGNVKWSTRMEQTHNRRDSFKYLYNNKLYTIKELADLAKVGYSTMRARLREYNMPVEEAVTLIKSFKLNSDLKTRPEVPTYKDINEAAISSHS